MGNSNSVMDYEESNKITAMTTLQKAIRRAAEDGYFRSRALRNLGAALAEEGFILTDDEMTRLRTLWEPLQQLPERTAFEQISALARSVVR